MDSKELLWAVGGVVLGYFLFGGGQKPAGPDCSACANFQAHGNANERLLSAGAIKCKGGC